MVEKSDKPASRQNRISATEASRSFSRLLDEVEGGRRFLIHRHGRDVCVIAPPAGLGRRASECLALLRSRAPVLLDERFGSDLLEVLAALRLVEDRPSWGS